MMAGRRNSVLAISAAAAAAVSTAGFTSASTDAVIPRAAPSVRFIVAPAGNEVRYRVREQLARMPLPNDAIGKTTEIQGGMSVTAGGAIVSGESKFTVNAGSLTSDRQLRDNYIRRRTLEADSYPMIEFVPASFRGLPNPLPASGTQEFQLLGNLTVKGVTKPVIWNVKATLSNGAVIGTATTSFTFANFNLDQPQVPIVLSVNDSIELEYDFSLIQQKK